jgi:hypothetical protein
MANVKITELAAVTTIIPGTDVVPIFNGGFTKKITPLQEDKLRSFLQAFLQQLQQEILH